MHIEVEVRSFLKMDQYNQLLDYFKKNSEFINEDNQESYYFNGEHDLRLQRNDFYAKIWLKKGKIHDDYREEIEIKFDRGQFEELERLFIALGYEVEIKWFRKRFEFKWGGITVCLDSTKGYGQIIELEKLAAENDKEKIYDELKDKLDHLGINLTSKEEFTAKYQYYKENWKSLV
ncbi:MAG: hypothetical protein ABIB04_01655 [Patescibacteria group bacterium]